MSACFFPSSSGNGEGLGTCRWVYQNPFRNVSALDPAESSPLQYSHMGMLAMLPNGSMAASWQAAPVYWEGSDKQGIYWALSHDGGFTWGQCSLLVSPDGLPAWGPVLHVEVLAPSHRSALPMLCPHNISWIPYSAIHAQAGVVHLFYAVSNPKCWWIGEGGMHWACGGDIMMQSSSDSGQTWSAAKVRY